MSAEAATDFSPYVLQEPDGRSRLHLLVEGLRCGGCVARIERALTQQPGIVEARVNLSTRRLAIAWTGGAERAGPLAGIVADLGYPVAAFDPTRLNFGDGAESRALLRAMAVAGFAAGNVMLLSVSVWAGHFQDMGSATRDLLHWFSALIALPAIAYAGQPFFRSALAALKGGGVNMDVPISLAVLLAAGMSLHETVRGADHAYFDSAITLLFFLLIGRYLDRRARGKARSAAERLLALQSAAITVLDDSGHPSSLPTEQVRPGMTVLVAAGSRIPVDGTVLDGRSDVDASAISGETVPVAIAPGDAVFAGTVNQSAPVKLTVTAVGEGTLLAEIVRLMEMAEQRRGRYVALADRVARLYAPVVHALAAITFLGWILFGSIGWQTALLYAVAVLIVTCPCALGLAVPTVQVIASGRLMRQGTLLKSATALERLAAVDTVVFDKTGTLTIGRLDLDPDGGSDQETLEIAAGLAGASNHPLARALVRAVPSVPVRDRVVEHSGRGLSWSGPEGEIRLGNRHWCGVGDDSACTGPELWLSCPGHLPARIGFTDRLRPDATRIVGDLIARDFRVDLLSGDRTPAVTRVAETLGIKHWTAQQNPAAKQARLAALAAEGHRVLMVGDGLNDAPALAAASVSASPATASDIAQTAADAVFQGDRLEPVIELLTVARRADRLVKQNIALSFGYNAIAIPLAVAGLVTPLIAAICMSASSIAVVLNAMRLAGHRRPDRHPIPQALPSPCPALSEG